MTTPDRRMIFGAMWAFLMAVGVVVAVTAVIEWRRPHDVRRIVEQELEARDSIDQATADSIIARTDSIIARLNAQVSDSARGRASLELVAGLRAEHAIIMRNQAASRRREERLYSTLVNSICSWTRNQAQVCR